MEIFISESQQSLENRLFAHIQQHIAKKAGYMLLLVPAQASFLMERQIVERCGGQGFMTIEVMSFEKLCERILKTSGGRADVVIDRVGLSMLCKKAVKSLKTLRAMDPDQKDIHQKTGELIASLKAENITPHVLRSIAENQRQATRDKLLDVADIFQYIEENASAPDLRDLEKRAIERAAMASFLQHADVAVYGFDTFTALRIDMLRALLPLSGSLEVYLEMDEERQLYKNQQFFLRQLGEMAQSIGAAFRKNYLAPVKYASSEIDHVFRHVFAYGREIFQGPAPAIRVGQGKSKEEELRWVAQNILSLVGQGVHCREIAVMSGQPGQYENDLRDVFAQGGIPYFYDGKRSLKNSRLALFLLSAVDILESGWRIDHVLRHMKTHLLPLRAGEAEALAKFAGERRLFGSAFKTGFKNCDDTLEEARQRGFSPLIDLAERVKNRESLPLCLVEYMEALSLDARLEEEAQRLQEAGFGEDALFTRQLYEKARAILLQAEDFGMGMCLADFRDMLSCGFEAAQIAVIPPCTDEVTVGDVTHSIFSHKKAVFIIGANDGSLPPLPDYGGVFGQAETEEIKEAFPAFPDKPDYDSQKPFIRRCLCSGDALFLSYTDRDKNPSYVVDKILRTFPSIQVEGCDGAVVPSQKGGLQALASDIRSLCDGEEKPLKILGAYLQNSFPKPESLLSWALHTNSPTPVPASLAKGLYGELRGSASLVEGYYYCPYKSFLDRGILPSTPKNGAPDHRIAGIYAHQLLESFVNILNQTGQTWGSLSHQEIDQLIDQAGQAHQGEIPQFSTKRFQYYEKRIRQEVSASCKAIQSQLQDTACTTWAVEQPFGYHGELKIETPLGDISLVGKIDRIDVAESGGRRYVRVIDYKTGSAAFSPKKFAAGIGLQLVIYLMAVAALFDQAEPVGAFYFHVSYPVLKPGEGEEDRAGQYVMEGVVAEDYQGLSAFTPKDSGYKSMKISMTKEGDQVVVKAGENTFTRDQLSALMDLAREIVRDAAMSIYSGANAISPLIGDSSPCEYCPYGAVCRFDGIFSGSQCRILENTKKADLLKLAEERRVHETDA